MKRKPLHIDWDELETAFENRNEDLSYYLDLVTGRVFLEGEGEEAHFDDDSLVEDAVEAGAAPRRETTRLHVSSFTGDDELDWMDEFIEGDVKLADEIKDALGELVAQGNGEGFKDALRPHADARDRWFLFRSERLHEVMDAWLAEHHVTPAGPPPWKER
jgi:hypothetical protein